MSVYRPMRIAISPTAIKVTAAKNAARRASADLGVDVSVVESKHKFGSGVPEQPGTLVEGHLGALNRAKPLLDAPDATDATHALGVENTAAYMGGGKWTDPAVVVLLGRDGEETCTTSVGFPMPNKQLGQAISDEHKHTAGSDIAKDSRLRRCELAEDDERRAHASGQAHRGRRLHRDRSRCRPGQGRLSELA